MTTGRRATLGLISVLVLIILFSSANPAHAQPSGQATVTVTENIQPLYDVYGGNSNQITVLVTGDSASVISGSSFTITTFFKPTVGTLVNASESSLAPLGGGLYNVNFVLNTGAPSFSVTLFGSEGGASFLWRYLAGAPFATVNGLSLAGNPLYLIVVPSGNILSQMYAAKGGTLPLNSVSSTSGGGQVTYSIPSTAGLLVFQSTSFLPASVAITVAALVLVALGALNLFAQGRQLFDVVFRQLRALRGALLRVVAFVGGPGKGFKFRSLLQPRKLLAMFILCALLMAALGALGGPDPRLKAYVIGQPSSTQAIQKELGAISGNALVLTPSQDFTDFNVMSSVGQFNVAVLSNYTEAQIQQAGPFVLGNLGNVPIIIVDNHGDTNITTSIETLYPDQAFHVANAGNLTSPEQTQLRLLISLNQRTNILGLNVSSGGFKVLLEVEAVLSMVLVLLGWAYLGSLTSESRTMSDLSHLVLLIGAGVFVFFFSETIYVVTSSTLAVPLSLHAVNSDAHDVTAIGLLGFGGGSTPRLAAGFIGIMLGAVGAEGGLQFKKRDFALIAGVGLILLANPLFIGQYVYQGILLLFPIGNYAFGTAFTNSLSFKGFIYGFGSALGGDASQVYLLSAGKILFFAGLVPLAYMKRMGRTTTVIALLFVALMIGDGGVRVGEMTPDKTVIAVLPGIVAGFAFAAMLLGLAAVEKYVRGNWKSRG
ncbi:MAG: hypothetical protein OK474_03205 [Thaumarchaeota archaeon]|nr:hypothetical protein [Nitrososphaerota archaeon]